MGLSTRLVLYIGNLRTLSFHVYPFFFKLLNNHLYLIHHNPYMPECCQGREILICVFSFSYYFLVCIYYTLLESILDCVRPNNLYNHTHLFYLHLTILPGICSSYIYTFHHLTIPLKNMLFNQKPTCPLFLAKSFYILNLFITVNRE